MRRAKTFHHLNSSYFESALIFCTALFFSSSLTQVSNLLLSLRISFTRIPYLLLFPSNLVYPHPVSALISSNLVYPYPASTLIPFASRLPVSRICSNLFASRLLVSRICSYSLRISFTLIPHQLLSFTLYKNPVKCLNRLSLLRL